MSRSFNMFVRITGVAPERAEARLGEAFEYIRESVIYETRLHFEQVMTYVDLRKFDDAESSLEKFREILSSGEDWCAQVGCLELAEAVVAGARGEYGHAEEHFGNAREVFVRFGTRFDEA